MTSKRVSAHGGTVILITATVLDNTMTDIASRTFVLINQSLHVLLDGRPLNLHTPVRLSLPLQRRDVKAHRSEDLGGQTRATAAPSTPAAANKNLYMEITGRVRERSW